MAEDLEVRLVDAEAPDGEIAIADLVAIGQSFQELSLRIMRHCLDASPQGRPTRVLEELSQMRLRGISDGSTRLLISRGPAQALDLELSVQAEADLRFDDIIHAMAEDRRPEWVSDSTADSVAEVVKALKAAAPVVEARLGDREPIRIKTKAIYRETWTSPQQRAGDLLAVRGRLEKVDLRSHDFRIRDDVGNSIELHEVAGDQAVASLIGRQVTARGETVLNRSGRVVGLTGPDLRLDDDPLTRTKVPEPVPLSATLAAVSGPNPDGAVRLTDQQFDSFLEAIRS